MTTPASGYDAYVAGEWQMFAQDPTRRQQALDSVRHLPVARVLDVGCGGGQEMIPFGEAGASCVGIDIQPDGPRFGRRMYQQHHPRVPVHFLVAEAERIPCVSRTFDLVLCRVAIPYTDNRQALREMARVLKPGGVLLLKTHHVRYYVRKFLDGVRRRSPLFSIHALRVLFSGLIFQLTGRQPGGSVLLRESYLTERMLRRELRGAGLALDIELADSNPLTPSYRIIRAPDASARPSTS
jgi:SAM-dependent methyltransferase